jgi:hypothetical protein
MTSETSRKRTSNSIENDPIAQFDDDCPNWARSLFATMQTSIRNEVQYAIKEPLQKITNEVKSIKNEVQEVKTISSTLQNDVSELRSRIQTIEDGDKNSSTSSTRVGTNSSTRAPPPSGLLAIGGFPEKTPKQVAVASAFSFIRDCSESYSDCIVFCGSIRTNRVLVRVPDNQTETSKTRSINLVNAFRDRDFQFRGHPVYMTFDKAPNVRLRNLFLFTAQSVLKQHFNNILPGDRSNPSLEIDWRTGIAMWYGQDLITWPRGSEFERDDMIISDVIDSIQDMSKEKFIVAFDAKLKTPRPRFTSEDQ